ncbi:MAG: asparaginase [Alphaproteobacteria bacterium]
MPDTPIAARSDTHCDEIAVEVTRGDRIESRHRASCAVADGSGRIVHRWGDVGQAVYPRSAIKSIQAIPLVESGAAERFDLSAAELALACASHGGEPMHIEAVEAWLARLGLGADDLECGAHPPSHAPSAEALWRSGATPNAVHNNCSGKHAGMLTTARHLGEPTAGYIRHDHPVQQRVARVIGEMTDVDMTRAPRGIDGCSIPTYAIPLGAFATAMARLADPAKLADGRADAIERIKAAIVARPEMVAGTGRFCSALIRESGGRIITKTGAEGVYAAALPDLGLGVALKVEDGAGRASSVALAAVLRRLGALDDALAERLAYFVAPPQINRAGRRVGDVRAAAGWPPATARGRGVVTAEPA